MLYSRFFLSVLCIVVCIWGFPGDSDGKESACNAGSHGLIPRLGRSPGERNGYPLQYSCLENSMDRGVWWSADHGLAELDMTEQLVHTHSLCVSIPIFQCILNPLSPLVTVSLLSTPVTLFMLCN